MMMVLKKKTIIIATLVILIAAAGYVSTKYGRVLKVNNDNGQNRTEMFDKSDVKTTGSQSASSYFVDVKLGRENERTAAKQTLNEIINNKNSSKESKTKAENQLMSLVNRSEKEMVIESLIKAKGFQDAVVLLTDSSGNVTVKAKELNGEQANIIKNIVCKESGLPATKITVQSKE